VEEHKTAPAAEPGDDKANYYYYDSDDYSSGKNPEQVLDDNFFCVVKGLSGCSMSLLSAEIEIWSASLSQVGQPRTEADYEPFANIEGPEKDRFDPFDGGTYRVNYAYLGFLRSHITSPPR